ncbi:MAG: SGNH/GDSL hydrolase family protein, partial [Moorea sp. SIO2B7]|nr:SGNH/GDSL hydrolase family protein [Moorena sp. SIO2B7]
NGPVWIDYLAEDLGQNGLNFTTYWGGGDTSEGINFAFGGATSETYNGVTIPNEVTGELEPLPEPLFSTGLGSQLGWFQDSIDDGLQLDNENALFIVYAGDNDYNLDGQDDPTIPVENVKTALNFLIDRGAQNFLVPNLADLGDMPLWSANPEKGEEINGLVDQHNTLLETTLNNLSTNNDGIDIDFFDFNSVIEGVKGDYLFTDTACFDGVSTVCDNPEDHLYWDVVHITTPVHETVANAAFETLQAESVPEPASGLAILSLGVLGAGSVLKRNRQKISPAEDKVA